MMNHIINEALTVLFTGNSGFYYLFIFKHMPV
ncbi:hypothetical protein ABIC45_001039 [Mucilaginibacter rubeus]